MLNISKDQLKACISSTVEEGKLSSFAEYGQTNKGSGGLTVLFVCESLGNNGTCLITGASRSKLNPYAQLEHAVNGNRAMTLFPEEQKDILQKIKNNRRAIEQVIKAPDFIELMKKEFREVEKWET